MKLKELKKQVNERVEIQKMISDVKHTLDHRTYDGRLLVFNKIKYYHDTQNIFFKFNLQDPQNNPSLGIYNIVLKDGLHVSTITYDIDEKNSFKLSNVTKNLISVIKEYLDCSLDLTPIKIDFIKEHEKALDALNICEAHLFNVPDKDITVPESLIHAFKIGNVMYTSNPERYL